MFRRLDLKGKGHVAVPTAHTPFSPRQPQAGSSTREPETEGRHDSGFAAGSQLAVAARGRWTSQMAKAFDRAARRFSVSDKNARKTCLTLLS
jgi:hypothetical protein